MSSDRPYRSALSPTEIIAEVKRCSGTQFDTRVVDAFLELVDQYGEKFLVNSARPIQELGNLHYEKVEIQKQV
jgi:HD-GYP domain-containing protein (c-di-GMP phosphodiesterase class II)